jgi:2'-5' RNA ligase
MTKNSLNKKKSSRRSQNRNRITPVHRLLGPNDRLLAADNAPYEIVQTVEYQNACGSSTLAPTFSQFSFAFSNLDQYLSLSAVFDQYRIMEIECSFIPHLTVVNTVALYAGMFSTVVDYDDATPLTTVGQANDYQNCLTTGGSIPHKRRFTPHTAVAAYGGGVFTSYTNLTHPWIDTTSPGVNHFGLKTAWTTTSTNAEYDLSVRYRLQFRNVR